MEVNAMLDLVKQEAERIDSRFLEPACGSGNFLTVILERKLAVVRRIPAIGECRDPGHGQRGFHASICVWTSGLALRRNQRFRSTLSATDACVRRRATIAPERAPAQLAQAQFHCGKPPPAAEPSTCSHTMRRVRSLVVVEPLSPGVGGHLTRELVDDEHGGLPPWELVSRWPFRLAHAGQIEILRRHRRHPGKERALISPIQEVGR